MIKQPAGSTAGLLLDDWWITAALDEIHQERRTAGEETIEVRRIKYLNNRVEQDHRFIKRLTRPMLGFKSFISAGITLAEIEIVRMIKKGQLIGSKAN